MMGAGLLWWRLKRGDTGTKGKAVDRDKDSRRNRWGENSQKMVFNGESKDTKFFV